MDTMEPTGSETQTATPRTGLIAYFAGNPIAANLLMVLILVSGVVAGLRVVVEDYPEIDWRTVSVMVLAPGSSPREVEEDIVRRIEESVIGLEGSAASDPPRPRIGARSMLS